MKKTQLPSKICIICKRPFNWRKKWSKVWNEVKYCSNACKKKKIRCAKKSPFLWLKILLLMDNKNFRVLNIVVLPPYTWAT